jgi:hypothetical protein
MSLNQRTRDALESGEGILRLAPCWVPRSFVSPGRRLRLAPSDYYAFGADRGGIDERWFSSTTEAANENRTPDEGLSYVVSGENRFTSRDAIESEGARLIGRQLWEKFHRWPVFSKLFDNMGPSFHHMHQSPEQAKLVGQEGKPEAYYFPAQYNPVEIMIHFGESTEDEFFVSHEAAIEGFTVENTSRNESLVLLRYFGPDANPDAPEVGTM